MCTIEELFSVKSLLQGLVVSNIDKNKGQLYVEWPVAYSKRLKENTNDGQVFEEVDNEVEVEVIISQEWEKKGLIKYGPWRKGKLPYMYVIPKEKDVMKTRLIASYYNHPLRYLYKKVGKVLHWGLKKLSYMKQFTLHGLVDLRKKVKKHGHG